MHNPILITPGGEQMSLVAVGQLQRKMVEITGGKGASLNDMVSGGFPVPQGYIVCADTFA